MASIWRQLLVTLSIHHQTTFKYRDRLEFGPHRLMLRPRESRNLRLIAHDLVVTPAATVTWAHDVSGNSVATATFKEKSDTLVIESFAELTLDVDQWPVFEIAASAAYYPFLLSEDDMTDLGALRLQGYLDSSGCVREWAQSFVAGSSMISLPALPRRSPMRFARTRALSLQKKRSTEARGRAATSRSSLSMPCAVSVSGHASCRDTFTIRTRTPWARRVPVRLMLGRKCMSPVRVGSRLIRPTEVSAGSILSPSPSRAALDRRCPFPAVSLVTGMRSKEWMCRCGLRGLSRHRAATSKPRRR